MADDEHGTKPPNNVMGGDLENLWRVANRHLPTVEGAYNKQINNLIEAMGGPDTEKFGPCHHWWTAMAQTYRSFLWHTSMSLSTVSILMNQAIDEYKYVDGSNGEVLTEIGEHLEYITDDTDPVKPEQVPNDFRPNDIELPPDAASLDDVNDRIDEREDDD